MIDDEAHSPQLSLGSLKAHSVLGRGAKGVVFLVSGENNEPFALKVISKALIAVSHRKKMEKKKRIDDVDEDCSSEFGEGSEYKRIWFERDVLKRLEHPLLPKLRGVVENQKIVGYALDYCPGSDLNSLRRKQSERMFSDDIIRFYAAELVLILDYLHKVGIVYRDLKPENVMIQASGHLMLVDFDLSKKLMFKTPGLSSRTSSSSSSSSAASSHQTSTSSSSTTKTKRRSNFYKWCNTEISPEEQHHSIERGSVSDRSDNLASVLRSNSFVGTEEYVAPEIIRGDGHEFGVDWWSLGVVLHEMLYGATPFVGSNRKETFYRILSKTPELVGEATPLRDLIRKLLEKDPKKRIGVDEIKEHEFFKGVCWETVADISRPPWIPSPDEECELGKGGGIDVESFVDNVFTGEVTAAGDGEGCKISDDGEDHSHFSVVDSAVASWEGYNVSHVMKPGGKENHTIKLKAESRVFDSSVYAKVQVPVVFLSRRNIMYLAFSWSRRSSCWLPEIRVPICDHKLDRRLQLFWRHHLSEHKRASPLLDN